MLNVRCNSPVSITDTKPALSMKKGQILSFHDGFFAGSLQFLQCVKSNKLTLISTKPGPLGKKYDVPVIRPTKKDRKPVEVLDHIKFDVPDESHVEEPSEAPQGAASLTPVADVIHDVVELVEEFKPLVEAVADVVVPLIEAVTDHSGEDTQEDLKDPIESEDDTQDKNSSAIEDEAKTISKNPKKKGRPSAGGSV